MKTAYFDCFAGASGDMILGALLDAGLGLEILKEEIAKLHLHHYDIQVKKVRKKGLGGSQALITIDSSHHDHHHRHLSDIQGIIEAGDLAAEVKEKSIKIFTRLAEAEAGVHRSGIEDVHFHEVGAMDAIIDVVGAVAGLHALNIEKVFCSPLHTGSGTVTCAHGILPVPAPATAELIKGIPVYATDVKGELLTPTGAAILTTLSSGFGPMPAMTIRQIGYGAGMADPQIPNLLRVCIGESGEETGDGNGNGDRDETALIECNIDDMNPQLYDYLMGKILDMGAMDVFLTAVQMKKNRPGNMMTILCPPKDVEKFAEFLFRETSTIGLRWRREQRIKAKREIRLMDSSYGPVHIKIAEYNGRTVNLSPEYEDCKRIALEKNIPLKQILDDVKAEASRFIGISE